MSEEQKTEWLSVQEVAKILGAHPNTVRRAIAKKQIEAFRIGEHWRIRLEAVQQYLAGRSNMGGGRAVA